MLLTIVLFFVLIGSFAALFGVVKFAENVISRRQVAPATNAAQRGNNLRAKSA